MVRPPFRPPRRPIARAAAKATRLDIKWKDYKLVSLIAELYVRMLNDEYRLSYKIKIYEEDITSSL